MLNLVEIELVYIKETTDEQRNPINIEKKISALAKEKGAFSTYYYQSENRNMDLSNNIEFDKEFSASDGWQLRFINLEGIKYKVINLLKSKNNPRKIIADVERVK